MKALLIILYFTFFLQEPTPSYHFIKIKLLNSDNLELKDGSVFEYRNSINFLFSKQNKCYFLKVRHYDTLSLGISHVGYEPLNYKMSIKKMQSDTPYFEFKMHRLEKIAF